MKLKTVFAASLLIGGVAFADSTEVTTEYTIGVLPISITTPETIIAIPWVEAGATTNGVAVANLIKTAGLESGVNGDMLYWYDTSARKYAAWYINGSGEWTSFSGGDEVLPNDTVLLRGQAALLKLTGDLPKTVYVVGQYYNGPTDVITITPKGEDGTQSKVTMIAPPKTEASSLNDATWTGVGASDTIFLSSGTGGCVDSFIYKNGKWGKETPSATPGGPNGFDTDAEIPAGFGVFYVSDTATDTAPTVQW